VDASCAAGFLLIFALAARNLRPSIESTSMLPVRCVVLTPTPTARIVPALVETLRRITDVRVEQAATVSAIAGGPTAATSSDVAVVVADRSSLSGALEQIAELLRRTPCCTVIAVGDALNEREMVSLLAAGAFDFVASPFAADELQTRIRRALGLTPPVDPWLRAVPDDLRLRDLIGTSAAFVRQTAKLPVLAANDVGVLLLGETGTGKEVFAQAIHYLSARASRPWVAVNCAAIPADLIESELFGHVRGAYTTAHTGRKGLVSEAEGGTLLLDEIDCLSYGAQAKLLRFLQEKEFRQVGSNAVTHADVRVIATSNSRLAELAAKGTFRQDLFFRLNVLSVTLPSLRDRQDDIPLLARHFIQRFRQTFNRQVTSLTPLALRKLLAYSWPGNVRELKHVIERGVILAGGPMLDADDLDLGSDAPEAIAEESFHDAKARVVESFERAYIQQMLSSCGGNVSHAARLAKKNRRAFWELLRKHHINPQPFR
jgi:two-component system response regulator GlrR